MAYDTINDWLTDYGHPVEPLLITELRDKGFDDNEILKFLDVYDDICHACRDGGARCQCWNDE